MSSIYDLAITKTLDAVFEAASTSNGWYVNNKDGSLLCSHWLPAFFTPKISVADTSTVTAKLEAAFSITERMHELLPDQANQPEINKWVLSALRAWQVFEAAKARPTENPMINEIAAHHTFEFHLPDDVKRCAVGRATAPEAPYQIAQSRGPNIIEGRYFYKESISYLSTILHMAHNEALTQLERLKSLIATVIQAVAGIFGFSLSSLNQYHYFRNHETAADIYEPSTVPMPLDAAHATRFSSYWIGHATCLFSVPVRSEDGNSSRINIITDPIKGDSYPLLCPRMTHPARSIGQCPPIHVCIISHNHRDHFSPETLQELLPQDPLMVVPKGDGERLRSIGFTRVVELGWFERVDVQVRDVDGKTYQLQISGVPSNHGSGNQVQAERRSSFNGYVIQSEALDGDVYFAGDTARLDAEHTEKLRDTFSIKYSFQPGGPDERRELNVDSHQASCDGISMHLHLMVSKVYRKLVEQQSAIPSFEQLRAACAHRSTIYMHTKTYKLGTVHFDDTDASVARVLGWLQTHDTWDTIATTETLKPYEKKVLEEIAHEEGSHLTVAPNQTPLTPRQIGELLDGAIIVPKIGARFTAQ